MLEWHRGLLGFAAFAVGGIALGQPVQAQAVSTTYTYDTLGRVTQVSNGSASTITFGYDQVGNWVTVTPTGSNATPIVRADNIAVLPFVPTRLHITANDTDRNGQPFTITNATNSGQSYGTFFITPDGQAIQYTANTAPAAGQTIIHQIDYTVSDGSASASGVVTISINEMIPDYGASSNYNGLFSGLINGGQGMRDVNFGAAGPSAGYSTTHSTNNNETANNYVGPFLLLDLGVPRQLAGFALAPMSSNMGLPSSSMSMGALALNGGYVSYSPDGTNWYSGDNISRAQDGAYALFSTDDMFVRYIGISKLSGNYQNIALGDIRLLASVAGAGGFPGTGVFAASAPASATTPPVINAKPKATPLFRVARFEKHLAAERAKLTGVAVAAAALPPTTLAETNTNGGSIGPIPLPDLAAAAARAAAAEDAGERIPVRFRSSSALSDAYSGLEGSGMRDGGLAGAASTYRTSISASEYIIAEFEQPVSISRIELATATDGDNEPIRDGELEASSDCKNWRWISRVNTESNGEPFRIGVNLSNVMCVRIQTHGAYLTISEFRFY